MVVNDYLLDLYFESKDGEILRDGFEALLLRAAQPWDQWTGAQPIDAGGEEGAIESHGEADTSDDDATDDDGEALSPEGAAFCAFFDGIDTFGGVWPALLRRLPPRDAVGSSQDAQAVYLATLTEGFEIAAADRATHDRFARAIGILAPQEAPPAPTPEPVPEEGGVADGRIQESAFPEEKVIFGGVDAIGLKHWAGNIEEISWAFHLRFPEWFAPYCFSRRFHHFDAICAEFGIALPRLPGKSSRRELAEYYFSINQCLQSYRREIKLTPAEFNAFLYGFASRYVDVAEVEDFGAPERVWLLLGHPQGDYEWLEGADESSVSHWQGSDGIRPGDLCVMWVRTPHSCTHSVWRAISRGYNDPFFWHYRTVWIGHRIAVPRIRFKELSAHPTWAHNPSVRAHFQGASGREISPAEYDALIEMWEQRGFDTSGLPRLAKRPALPVEGVDCERDVEVLLLEPLLRRLGYEESDWIRQYRVRMGRGEVVRPDYAFGMEGDIGEEHVRMLVEAKHRISSAKDLREAYLQARSYGERLRARLVILCAVEGLWLFGREQGTFSIEKFERFDWLGASEGKVLDHLLREIGRDALLKDVDRRGRRDG